jgi:hypothetical protein
MVQSLAAQDNLLFSLFFRGKKIVKYRMPVQSDTWNIGRTYPERSKRIRPWSIYMAGLNFAT